MTLSPEEWGRLAVARDRLREAGFDALAELVWDQAPQWASAEQIISEATGVSILGARERIMHRYLDRVGAPNHDSGNRRLNICGRFEDWQRQEHPERDLGR